MSLDILYDKETGCCHEINFPIFKMNQVVEYRWLSNRPASIGVFVCSINHSAAEFPFHAMMVSKKQRNMKALNSGANAYKLFLPNKKKVCLRLRVKLKSQNRRIGKGISGQSLCTKPHSLCHIAIYRI